MPSPRVAVLGGRGCAPSLFRSSKSSYSHLHTRVCIVQKILTPTPASLGVLLAAWGWFDVWCVQVGALIAAWVCAWVCLAGALGCCASCVECRAGGPVLKTSQPIEARGLAFCTHRDLKKSQASRAPGSFVVSLLCWTVTVLDHEQPGGHHSRSPRGILVNVRRCRRLSIFILASGSRKDFAIRPSALWICGLD